MFMVNLFEIVLHSSHLLRNILATLTESFKFLYSYTLKIYIAAINIARGLLHYYGQLFEELL